MLGIPSKNGSLPDFKFATGSMRNEGGNHIVVAHHSPTDRRTVREVARSGQQVQLEFKFAGGRRMTARYASQLSRALDGRFDHIRDAVLGSPRCGFLMFATSGDPDDNGATIQYDFDTAYPDGGAIGVAASLLGVGMGTHSLRAEPYAVPNESDAQVIRFTERDFKRSR